MNRVKTFIASFLLLVYSFSVALSASTGLSVAGLEVKKECPNKDKFKPGSRAKSLLSFQFIKAGRNGEPSPQASPPEMEICSIYSSFLSANLSTVHPPVFSKLEQTEPVYLYQSPDLKKRIDPPQVV